MSPLLRLSSAYLSEVSRVELVKKDTVVVLTTGVTAPTGMLPVLPDTAMARRDVPPLLAVLRETRRLSFRETAATNSLSIPCRAARCFGWRHQNRRERKRSTEGAKGRGIASQGHSRGTATTSYIQVFKLEWYAKSPDACYRDIIRVLRRLRLLGSG